MSETFLIFIIVLFFLGFGGFFVYMIWQRNADKKKIQTDENQSNQIKDLERRLTDLMISTVKEMRGSVDGGYQTMQNQMQSFTREATQIREDLKQVQSVVKDVSTFQEIFKSPKLRGQWGEASLEHTLSQHFPPERWQRQ
jgi:DNA anti-recombination protein RmuC